MPTFVAKPDKDPTTLLRMFLYILAMLVFGVIFFISISILINNLSTENGGQNAGPYDAIISTLQSFFSLDVMDNFPGLSSFFSVDSIQNQPWHTRVWQYCIAIFFRGIDTIILYSPYIVLSLFILFFLCLIYYKSILRMVINQYVVSLHANIQDQSSKLNDLKIHPSHGLVRGIHQIRLNRLDNQIRIAKTELEGYQTLLKRLNSTSDRNLPSSDTNSQLIIDSKDRLKKR